MPRTMRVRFKPDAVANVGEGKTLMLGNEEAEVTATEDGRFRLKIPRGERAGEEIFVEEDLFERIGRP